MVRIVMIRTTHKAEIRINSLAQIHIMNTINIIDTLHTDILITRLSIISGRGQIN